MNAKTFCFNLAAVAAFVCSQAASAAVPDQVKKDFAKAVYAGSPDLVHDRNPQPLLRAVIVLSVKLDENNQWKAEVIRGNDQQPEMQARAIETVRRAPVPTLSEADRAEMQRSGLMEAWLFDSDGTFQVKTLAKAQKTSR
ncbi:MAG: hypothetical protein RI907_3946 [Pseudomonadota bacterium]|jgi:hypothetical protein